MNELYLDRLVLAIGVLNGEASAHQVLGDLLEEDGEQGLAQWARARKRTRYKRVDFVLAVLPYQVSLAAGCEFLIHALSIHTQLNRLGQTIEKILAWANFVDRSPTTATVDFQQTTTAEFHSACAALCQVQLHGNFPILDRVLQSMHFASVSAKIANVQAREGKVRSFRAQPNQTRNGIRRVAKGCREFVKPLLEEARVRRSAAGRLSASAGWRPHRNTSLESNADITEPIKWQIEHLCRTLDRRLESFTSENQENA